MSGAYGVAFPTAAAGYAPASPTQQQVQIQPGSITYTTSATSDGRIQYNQFRAEARSYQTPQGLVHGIQWVPVNMTYDLPPNAQPAGPDFHASWGRSNSDKEAQRALKEWQREQEKRVKKEEKESAKRMKEWERERREREKAEEREFREKDRRERERAEEKEFRKMQERDSQRGRMRRPSDAGYGADYPIYSAPSAAGYSRARSRSQVRGGSVSQEDITRAMAEMAMDNDWTASEWGEQERRSSNVGRSRKISANERSRRVSVHEYERARKTSGTPYPTATYLTGAQAGYGGPPSPGRTGYSDRISPYMGGGILPPAGATVPVYPEGHIYAGKPIPGFQGPGMASSYRGPSPAPGRPPTQMELPVSFTRPPSLAMPYTYFETFMLIPNLDGLVQHLPPMPAVLAPHDVWPEDWMQCFEDLTRTWLGKWPERKASSRKPQKSIAELIDIWNASFFSLRGVELILSRGRQRLSGPQAGHYDDRFRTNGSSDDDSETISSVSSDSDTGDRYEFYGSTKKGYTASGLSWLSDSREARRARKAKKNKERQKKRERREREREGSRYTIHLSCIGDGQPPRLPMQAPGYPSPGYPI